MNATKDELFTSMTIKPFKYLINECSLHSYMVVADIARGMQNKMVTHDEVVLAEQADSVLMSRHGSPFGVFYDRGHTGIVIQNFGNVKTRLECLDRCEGVENCYVVEF